MIREADGAWREVDWETALEAAARGLQGVREARRGQLGVLAAPSARSRKSTCCGALARGLGIRQHRSSPAPASISATRPRDPAAPSLGRRASPRSITLEALLVVGSNLRRKCRCSRIACARRLRGRAGLVPESRAVRIPVPGRRHLASSGYGGAAPGRDAGQRRCVRAGAPRRRTMARARRRRAACREHERVARCCAAASARSGWARWRCGIRVRGAARAAQRAGGGDRCTLGYLPEGGNAAGASLAGVLPHRGAGGRAVRAAGPRRRREMLDARLRGYLLWAASSRGPDSVGRRR